MKVIHRILCCVLVTNLAYWLPEVGAQGTAAGTIRSTCWQRCLGRTPQVNRRGRGFFLPPLITWGKRLEYEHICGLAAFFNNPMGYQFVPIIEFKGCYQMVTRHRLNLSLSEVDFQRLSDLARAEGKMPTTFALDYLKALLLGSGSVVPKRVKTPVVLPELDRYTMPLPGLEKRPTASFEPSLPSKSRADYLESQKIADAQKKRAAKAAKRGK